MSNVETDAIAVLKILGSPDMSVKYVIVASKALRQGIKTERVNAALAYLAELEWIQEAPLDGIELTEAGRKEAKHRGFSRLGKA
jgi:Mn-dependent DtxR family transcriptional regulator